MFKIGTTSSIGKVIRKGFKNILVQGDSVMAYRRRRKGGLKSGRRFYRRARRTRRLNRARPRRGGFNI